MKNLLSACLLISTLVHTEGFPVDATVGDSMELELGYSVLSYDCAFIGDTLNLVVLNRGDDALDYYQVRGSDALLLNKIDAHDMFYGPEGSYWELTDDLCLILRIKDRFKKVDMRTGYEQYFLEFDTADRSYHFIVPEGYYSDDSIACFLFRDCGRDKSSGLAINQARTYNKTYFIDMNDSEPRRVRTVQTGRTTNRDFIAMLYGDTLYAVWNETRWKSWLSGVSGRSTVFSKYNGRNWQEPVGILELDDKADVFETPQGLYVIDDRFYVFWRSKCSKDGRTEQSIFFVHSADQRNWSAPIEIEGEYDWLSNQEFWSTQCISDGYLHILIGDGQNRKQKRYCTFNGGKWEDHGVVIDGVTFSGKLRLDGSENVYILWTSGQPDRGRLFYRKVDLVD